MTEIATSEVLISALPTKEVILAPKQVTIVREIHTTIKPGQNEITILGLDGRVNSDSIRIEGSGPATITDIQTSIVPRREKFNDVYPSDSDEDESSTEEDISEDEEGLNDIELQAIQSQINNIEERIARARSDMNSSLAVLGIMDEYGKGLQNDETKDMEKFREFLNIYSVRRASEAERNHKAVAALSFDEKRLAKLQKKFNRRKTRYLQEQRAASKAIRVRNEKRARARDQKKAVRNRKRHEQRRFWSERVGQVVVSLDSQTATFTPGSSRRSSVVEKVVEKIGDDTTPQASIDVMLRLSYIVPGSSWASRYELAINSPSSSAKMTYRAEFNNSSTETWRDTRVTLSTSQASFSGIGARIPSLDAWNIKLVTAASKSPSWDRILDAPKGSLGPVPPPFPPSQLSGAPAPQVAPRQSSLFANIANVNTPSAAAPTGGSVPAAQTGGLFGGLGTSSTSGFGSVARQEAAQPVGSFGAFRAIPSPPQGNPTGSLFGASAAPTAQQPPAAPAAPGAPAPPAPPVTRSLFGQAVITSQPSNEQPRQTASKRVRTAVELEEDDNSDTQSITSESLEHQDSVKQDYGMTTTYELPGRRTLAPSLVSRRHVLAELDLKSVTLTYVIVPKHREAAFLRARIKNTSSLTLHPGQVGITVDGSFVGTARLETCGPKVFFNISLGVDPGIEVKYAKPVVKPITGAMFFNKEDGAKFRRSCWVKNTKSVAVDLVVSDQVPVSDDEKLRVRLLQPAGIEKEGDEALLQMEKRKGRGTASLLKNGEVKWTLRLEPREEIRLVLEYEAKVPSGSDVISGSG